METNKRKIKPKAGLRQWIYFSITALLTVLFCLWTGYYACLLFIIILFDIYISRIVPWGIWRNSKNPKLRTILDWVDAIVFALVGVWFLNTFFFQNYQIPSSSLEKSLLVGDFLLVSKVSYGGRTPMTPLTLPLTQHTIETLGVKSYLEKPHLAYKRLKGTGSIGRNDIVVFNYPSGDTVALKRQAEDYYVFCQDEGRSSIWANPQNNGEVIYRPVDRRENYVKRCVALPGETIYMRNDSVFVDGTYTQGADNEQHLYYVQTNGTPIALSVFDELGISNEDKAKISHKDISTADSLTITQLGLAYDNQTAGYLYLNVTLTKKMAEQLRTRKFVRSIIKRNQYLKSSGEIENKIYPQLVYPITYTQNTAYGDFPETWIPKRGATIYFDKDVEMKYHTYLRCMKNYELNEIDYRNGIVYINGEQADSYTFKMDYYFMMGDNRDNSADSRVWGFVPEDHVVGKPLFVWLSLDPDKGWLEGKIRWNRVFTGGNKK